MKKTQALVLISAMLLAASLLYGQSDFQQLGWQEFPISSIDNLFIPYSNPSLLATGNASGLGIVHMLDDEQFVKRYWLMLNTEGASYTFERDHGTNYHMLAIGNEMLPANILPNLYTGTNYRFEEGNFDSGTFRSAISYRPTNYASLAFTWDNPMKDKPFYRFGAALRPFAFTPAIADYRLEFSMDVNYSKVFGGDYEVKDPILGVNTQILDGVKLGATYNFDEETAFISFSLSQNMVELGGLARSKENDNYGYTYAHLSSQSFKPFLNMHRPSWYQMPAKARVVTYKAPKYSFGPINVYEKNVRNLDEIISEIEKAKQDPAVNGILLVNPSFAGQFAIMQELITAFDDFKASGKEISIYYDNISNGGYIFAAKIADRIYLNPMGVVDLRGLSINSPYFKDLLDTIGVEVVNFRSHQYKNAGNMFSESEMTTAEREVYESILQSLYEQIVAQIQSGRGDKILKPIEQVIDEGPYFIAQDAFDLGLIDELIYQDELSKTLGEDFTFSARKSALADYRSYDWSKPKENHIAVIYASGNIVMGKGTPGQKIAHETTVNRIRKARKDNNYKGIILRVDSGGGSAQASDIILRELELAQTENNKPVVVSMAGVAASGGYYIAAKADRIIANPATLTGSIGVIGMAFNATELFEKIRVNWSTVKIGERSDMGSMFRPWTEEEKDILTAYIEHTYEDFIRKVAAGRKNLTVDEVHEVAQGRIWTGEQALSHGLIDDLGGMDKAVEHMRELTGINGCIKLIDATGSKTGINLEMESFSLLQAMNLGAFESVNNEYIKLYDMWKDYQDEKILMLSPIDSIKLDI